jgi:hypothetical protein
MNKEELMVGNLVEILTTDMQVNLPTGRYGVIEEIREDKVKIRYDYETSDNHCFFNRRYDTIRPIKLNGEILQRLGFVKGKSKYGDDYILIRNDYEIYFVVEHWTDTEENSKWKNHWFIKYTIKPYDIKYVHQLQNLFYSLTGEKLTFKSKENETGTNLD